MDESITKEKLLNDINNENDANKKVNLLISLVNLYIEGDDISSALKYASLASICTYSPRADVCCVLGDLYSVIKNFVWARRWYESAINNVSDNTVLDSSYYTWYPLIRLANISTNEEEAKKYLSAAEIMNPNYINDMQDLNA